MLIVSATITGSREDEISDAIGSVAPHVDKVLIVDTGITDRTIARALEVARDKLVIVKHAWKDFSAARNVSLDEAKKLGADWIVIVDSDERFHWNGIDLREALSRTTSEVLYVESSDGHYPKEKIIRAVAAVRYVGPTHEVPLGGSRETLRGVTFSELSKTQAQLAHKFSRDAELLGDYVAEHPDDPRWWFYLGQSFEGLGKHARAAEAFGQCVTRRKYGDEAAWAAYKQAEQLHVLGRHEEAIAAAGRGLGASVFYGECAWTAVLVIRRPGAVRRCRRRVPAVRRRHRARLCQR
jgi:glycosyltransferase involved in cell wall biosynthesis